MKVAIYGASSKPERYSYKAFRMLREKGHQVFPIHIRIKEIEGVPVYRSLGDIKEPIHTLTLYMGPAAQESIMEDILSHPPQRVVFNPGTENPPFREQLEQAGVQTLEACTLVMLRTNQWEPPVS